MAIHLASEPIARGRRSSRIVGGIAFLVVAVVGSVFLVRMSSLRGLPSSAEPFDTRAYATISIPDDENAFTYFCRATDNFVGLESDIEGGAGLYTAWSQVPPKSLRSLEQNRDSLSLWMEGTKRNRAVYMQPGMVTFETQLPVIQQLRVFSRLASLKAMQLRLDGDHAGAWAWMRANLRSGLLSGQNGFPIERLVGMTIYAGESAQVIRWADDPNVNAKLLRRALDDVVAAEAIAPDYAQMIRYEYYSAMNTLADPEMCLRALREVIPAAGRTWHCSTELRLAPAYAIFRREPERSRRVIRLVTANWLSGCDLPAAERARRAIQIGGLSLYRPSPDKPTPLTPEDLAPWYESTLYARLLFTDWNTHQSARRRDEGARAALIIHLAERLYEKERGRPPSSSDDLIGPYLKSFPVGYIRHPNDPSAQGPPR